MRLSALSVGLPSASTKRIYTLSGSAPLRITVVSGCGQVHKVGAYSVVPMILPGCPKATCPKLTWKHTKKLYALNCERFDGCFNFSSDIMPSVCRECPSDKKVYGAPLQRCVCSRRTQECAHSIPAEGQPELLLTDKLLFCGRVWWDRTVVRRSEIEEPRDD